MQILQKNPRLKSLSILLLTSIATLGISWSYADIIPISGIFGNPHVLGQFSPGGNAGSIIFSGMTLDPDFPPNVTLKGKWVFLETVGWAQLENQTTNLTFPDISIPIEVGSGVSAWLLQSPIYAWSDNAGWLTLHSLDPNSYSGVAYIPGSQSFSGYAWSDTLGYVDFSSANTVFKNKVKILGNIGGNKAYDTEYYVGNKFDSVSVTSLLNTIRKNIALMTRGIGDTDPKINKIATNKIMLNSDTLYYRITGSVNNPGNFMNTTHTRSLIVEGGDVYIDSDISKDPQVDNSRVIIVMKDKSGNGGNIYLGKNVKNIYTSLIAEGTIYSGESSGVLYNDVEAKVIHLPQNQLYILGSVISRNTIGGATLFPNFSCPYTEGACDRTSSIKYDWNYFRTYDKSNQSANGSNNHNWEDYSIIIEHDPRILTNPPPGLNNE